MSKPKLCQDCRWSRPERELSWNNRCLHPSAVARDAWALATNAPQPAGAGVDCHTERGKRSLFAACGMRGKLWEEKP